MTRKYIPGTDFPYDANDLAIYMLDYIKTEGGIDISSTKTGNSQASNHD